MREWDAEDDLVGPLRDGDDELDKVRCNVRVDVMFGLNVSDGVEENEIDDSLCVAECEGLCAVRLDGIVFDNDIEEDSEMPSLALCATVCDNDFDSEGDCETESEGLSAVALGSNVLEKDFDDDVGESDRDGVNLVRDTEMDAVGDGDCECEIDGVGPVAVREGAAVLEGCGACGA